ncbi:MAG TPA: glycosyltransferase [Pyrinomonadaceae bacterium]|nr:glycosyltransferase [Pyrinomonadaceae bacterium]
MAVAETDVLSRARARRLRVLHVGKFYPPHKGGMETHLRDLCERLTREVEPRVVVAASVRGPATDEMIDGVRVRREAKLFGLGSSPVCPRLARSIRESRADIVHLHFPNPAAILSYLASGHAGRVVVTYHSDIVRQRLTGRAFRPVLEYFLRRCSAVIATSPDYVESSPVLSKFRERCRVIPLGIVPEKFERVDEAAVRSIRERYGPRIVLGVGRLIYYKGFEHLIRAMRETQARLLVVGEGPLRRALERERDALGESRSRVVLLGEVGDAAPYFRAADVFALASTARSEAFGIVQLEAMACGVPVVNTWLASGVPFVSPDGLSGITVPPADPSALARALKRLLDDPSLRAKLGEAGRRRVRGEFTADLMAERTLELYREVADSKLP